jgi:hypothetical protein
MEEGYLSRRQERHTNQELGHRKTQYSQRSCTPVQFLMKRIGQPNHIYTNYGTLVEYIALLDILKSTVAANIGKRQDITYCFKCWCIECTFFHPEWST